MAKTKLYLCDGFACGKEVPSYCYLVGGECCHTSKEEFSATKQYPDVFKNTNWVGTGDVSMEIVSPEIYLKRMMG